MITKNVGFNTQKFLKFSFFFIFSKIKNQKQTSKRRKREKSKSSTEQKTEIVFFAGKRLERCALECQSWTVRDQSIEFA